MCEFPIPASKHYTRQLSNSVGRALYTTSTAKPQLFLRWRCLLIARISADLSHFHTRNTASISMSIVIKTPEEIDRKSTRLNSSHVAISYAVFCLKKKKRKQERNT